MRRVCARVWKTAQWRFRATQEAFTDGKMKGDDGHVKSGETGGNEKVAMRHLMAILSRSGQEVISCDERGQCYYVIVIIFVCVN